MKHAFHPLWRQRLADEGRRRVGGVSFWIVRLPDGTPGTLAVQATDAADAASQPPKGPLARLTGVCRPG